MAVGGFDEEELEELERKPELQTCTAGQADGGFAEAAQKGSVRPRKERTKARLVWERNMPMRMVDSRARSESKTVVVTDTAPGELQAKRKKKNQKKN